MITELQAKNFKSWRRTGKLRLSSLTGFFGTNSSGKTSLAQILLLLKQTAESADRKQVLNTGGDEQSPVDLGTFYDLIYGHQEAEPLELGVCWDLPEPLSIDDPNKSDRTLFTFSNLCFRTSITAALERPLVRSFKYCSDHQELGMRKLSNESGKDEYELVSEGTFKPKRIKGRVWPLPAPVKCYGFPDEALGYYQNTGFLPDLVLQFEGMLRRVAYLGPLRDYPKRSYTWTGISPSDVGKKGENAIAALLAARKRKISWGKGQRSKTVEERIAYWLKEMGVISSFSLKQIGSNRREYEVRVKRSESAPEVLITDVGFGVSQVLPVLVLCYYVPEGSTIILEQPEIHLHPFVQATLADVFIEVVNRRRVQLIVESHSEHLLRRLQRRIAEQVISEKSASLYFCRSEKGESQADLLEVDEFGNIRNWPPNFFGDELGELTAMTEAVMKRQGAEA